MLLNNNTFLGGMSDFPPPFFPAITSEQHDKDVSPPITRETAEHGSLYSCYILYVPILAPGENADDITCQSCSCLLA